MIEFIVTGLVVSLVVSFVMCIHFSGRIYDLAKYLDKTRRELTYKSSLPQIDELAKLRGCSKHFLNYETVYFTKDGKSSYSNYVSVYEVEKELAALKKAIEVSCPKKCTKKK